MSRLLTCRCAHVCAGCGRQRSRQGPCLFSRVFCASLPLFLVCFVLLLLPCVLPARTKREERSQGVRAETDRMYVFVRAREVTVCNGSIARCDAVSLGGPFWQVRRALVTVCNGSIAGCDAVSLGGPFWQVQRAHLDTHACRRQGKGAVPSSGAARFRASGLGLRV